MGEGSLPTYLTSALKHGKPTCCSIYLHCTLFAVGVRTSCPHLMPTFAVYGFSFSWRM